MNRLKLNTLALAAALIATSLVDTGFGSPPYPLGSLFRRAETVLIVNMSSDTDTDASFEVTQILRGDAKLQRLSLGRSLAGRDLPKNTQSLLLFSQGDNYWGPPKDSFQVGQGIKGQASYRGWILMDGPGQSTEKLDRLKELLKQNPYKPDLHGRLSARILLPAEIKPDDGAHPAKLDLTNTGGAFVRVLTRCHLAVSTFTGWSDVRLRPQSEEHTPSLEELAKSVVELSPGESTTLPFQFTDPGREMPQVTASYEVSENLSEKLNVWCGVVRARIVFARTDGGVLRILPPEQFALCGSRLSIEEALRQEFAFATACEALEDTQGMIGAIGKLNCTQEFKFHQLLAGNGPGVGKFRLHYTYVDYEDCRERAVEKGERVIWIVREKPGDVPPWHGTKALPDTPENRDAVLAALAKEQSKRAATLEGVSASTFLTWSIISR